MSLGQRVRVARGSLSREELARRLKVNTKTVYRWENGQANPEADTLVPLADELGVAVRWLLTGEGEGPAEAA